MPTTQLDADSPWRRVASLSAHPSTGAVLEPGDLLPAIAAGIGAVTVPLPALPVGAHLQSEMLLDTAAYEVWIMNLAPGESTDVHTHPADTAIFVVSGSVQESRDTGRMVASEGSTLYLPAGAPHSLLSIEASTTIHVHAKEQP